MDSPYHITTLANGFRVATAEMPHMASVSLGLWVGVGSRHEAAPLNGACHFIEHMLFKGTRRRSARRISEEVEGIGGYLNAFTSEENTCFHARVHHRHFGPVLDVLMDMFLHSRFALPDVAKERDVIKEEIAMYRDQPAQHVQEILNATTWPDHPLGRSITGSARSLDDIRRPQLTRFLGANYHAANTVLIVAGNIRHTAVVNAARIYAKHFPSGSPTAFAPAPADQREPRLALVTRETEQAQIAVGVRACSRHDERRYALRLLNAILGENMSSRLFQRVREDLGLAYNIYSTPSFYADAGDLVISAGLDTDNLPRVVRLIMAELRRCASRPPSAAELRRARDFAIGQFDLTLEGTENQMNFVGEQVLGYGRITTPQVTQKRLAAVTAAQIMAVAADFFRPDRLNVALVSRLKSPREIAPALSF